jgi:hypothetical protein
MVADEGESSAATAAEALWKRWGGLCHPDATPTSDPVLGESAGERCCFLLPSLLLCRTGTLTARMTFGWGR